MRRRSIVILALCAATGGRAQAQGSDSAAQSSAQSFLQDFDNGDLGLIYRNRIAGRFKTTTNQTAFVQNLGMNRIQLGGPAINRHLVGGQRLGQLPGMTIQGTFYYTRYVASYPSGLAFNDVFLELEGNEWKIVGFSFMPAPPSAAR